MANQYQDNTPRTPRGDDANNAWWIIIAIVVIVVIGWIFFSGWGGTIYNTASRGSFGTPPTAGEAGTTTPPAGTAPAPAGTTTNNTAAPAGTTAPAEPRQ